MSEINEESSDRHLDSEQPGVPSAMLEPNQLQRSRSLTAEERRERLAADVEVINDMEQGLPAD